MRFALLGNHPDGLAMADALVRAGRHELIVVCDVPAPPFAPQAKSYPEIEEVLADPEVELIIVAGPMSIRSDQLRRSVQSERDVLCVHPCAEKPDIAYEAALIQGDTKRLLLPLMPDALDPNVGNMHAARGGAPIRVLSVEQESLVVGQPPWDVLRRIGGEIVEVTGLAETEQILVDRPLVWSGRFEAGGLIHGLIRPALDGRASVRLTHMPSVGVTLSADDPIRWARLVSAIESGKPGLTWQDEVRALELQDALRRSVEKRRTSSLEYQEISEEVGNKGTLTLIGCGMIWLILLVVGMSIWWPPIRWAIVPLLGGYLVLLAMNWLARK
jgi:hypothetical protein